MDNWSLRSDLNDAIAEHGSPSDPNYAALYHPGNAERGNTWGIEQMKGIDLTDDEERALGQYEGAGYRMLNGMLSGTWNKSDPAYDPDVDPHSNDWMMPLLDSAIGKATLSEPVIAWRGGTDKTLDGAEVGDFIDRPAYTSTTLSEVKAVQFSDPRRGHSVLYKMLLPPGTHAAYLNGLYYTGWSVSEQELLIGRGTRWRIVEDKVVPDPGGSERYGGVVTLRQVTLELVA